MTEFTLATPAGDHRWTFSPAADVILCHYSLTRPRVENGITWRQCLSCVSGTLDPATMAPRPGRWVIRGRDLRLDLLPADALDQVRRQLVEVVA